MVTDREQQGAAGAHDPDELEALVVECLARHEREGDAALEALCREHSDQADALRSEIDKLRRVGLLAPAAGELARVPERLGEFRLLERIGSGGMGVVYAAEQVPLGRRVALKLVRPELVYFPEQRERFQREVRAVARMQHPGIVPVYAVGEENGIPFFAMELIEGCTLLDVLGVLAGRDPARLAAADLATAIETVLHTRGVEVRAAGALFEGSWAEACARLARQVAEALEHAHGRGVIHRDVKPSNIAVSPSGRAMLFDFGLASQQGAGHLTRSDALPGSLPYMSPEQLRGERDLDGRADVYALGVTLYEMLSLRRAFAADDTEELRRRIAAGSVPRLRELNAALPRELGVVCETAMDVARERRYATAGDLARDLGHVLARRPIEARPAGPWLRVLRWSQRHPTLGVAGALAVVLTLAAALSFGWQQQTHARELAVERDELRSLATEFLFEFHDSIRGLPGATRARALVVSRATGLLERLSGAAGDDRELQAELATAHVRLADVLGRPGFAAAGDLQAAAEHYSAARSIRTRLAQTAPQDTAWQRSLWEVEDRLAELWLSAGHYERGRAMAEAALVRARAIVAAESGAAGARLLEVNSLLELASSLHDDLEVDRALTMLREAASILDDPAVAAHAPARVRELREATWECAAKHHHSVGDYREAVAAGERALELRLAFTDGDATPIGARVALADCHRKLSYSVKRLGDFDRALAHGARAVEILEPLVQADAQDYEAKLALGETLLTLAETQIDARQLVQAWETLGSAARVAGEFGPETEDRRVLALLAGIHAAQGQPQFTDRSPRVRIDHNLRSAALYETLLAMGSGDASARKARVGSVYHNLGLAHGDAGELDLALASFDVARELGAQMWRAAPAVHRFFADLVAVDLDCATILIEAGRMEDARGCLERALGLLQARDPGADSELLLYRASAHGQLEFVLCALGEHAAAVEHACAAALDAARACAANPPRQEACEHVDIARRRALDSLAASMDHERFVRFAGEYLCSLEARVARERAGAAAGGAEAVRDMLDVIGAFDGDGVERLRSELEARLEGFQALATAPRDE